MWCWVARLLPHYRLRDCGLVKKTDPSTARRSANPKGVPYEVTILEPPIAGQLETTVEQSGIWRQQDRYLVERQTEYGKAIARILGYGSFLGRTIADERGLECAVEDITAGANLFLLPHMTLCDPPMVTRLRITANNFYGGAVGYAVERTKLIMHDIVHPLAVRPPGWNAAFAKAIPPLTLAGYSVFSREDLETAARNIIARFGGARIKLATGGDGHGQFVVESISELESVAQQMSATNDIREGVCIEVDLRDPTTYSVNTETVGDLKISSVGVHRRNMLNPAMQTEIGTDYDMVVGDVETIRLDLTSHNEDHIRRIMGLVAKFDGLVSRYLPHILLTRKTYQAIVGTDAQGTQHIGILEQSWRRGGSSANTLLAAQEFLKDPDLFQVSCSQDNAYAGSLEQGYWILSTRQGRPYVARVTGRYQA